MHSFASGTKRNYYGKADVSVYRLNRAAVSQREVSPIFGANVTMLLYGDAFWPTYVNGDNNALIATDSIKNFIQCETLNFEGAGLGEFCRFMADKFLATYPHVGGVQVSASELPYTWLQHRVGLAPSGPERATARVEIGHAGLIEAALGLRGLQLLRLGGSSFKGFIRDAYATLPDAADRPLHISVDLEWRYRDVEAAFNGGADVVRSRSIVCDVFESFESVSIQQLIHQIGTTMLRELPAVATVDLEACNRIWDSVIETGVSLGVYTDAPPPVGCIGLRLSR